MSSLRRIVHLLVALVLVGTVVTDVGTVVHRKSVEHRRAVAAAKARRAAEEKAKAMHAYADAVHPLGLRVYDAVQPLYTAFSAIRDRVGKDDPAHDADHPRRHCPRVDRAHDCCRPDDCCHPND